MMALSDVLQGISRAYSWTLSALAPNYITRPILMLVFMGGALIAGYPPTAVTAVTAGILATYLTTLAQLVDAAYVDIRARLRK